GAKWADAAIHFIHMAAFTSGRNPDTITIQEATEIFGDDDPDEIAFTHEAWAHQTGAQSDPQ
ncbi:MAG TPA: hypothetical protein VLL72_02360, partial [Kiloniellales bacterium]|nr:hypothetical protein [Kiloniellales bacterium]